MPSKKSLYSPHPALSMEETWIAGLPARTGKTLEEWVRLVQRFGPPTDKERRDWLKTRHNLGTNYAAFVAERAAGRNIADAYEKPEALVEAMFAGPKAGLRPVYEKLLRLGLSLGKDVKACPCKTIVPLYRKHVFAQVEALDEDAARSRPRAERRTGDGTPARHRRSRQGRSHHAPHRGRVGGGPRRGVEAVAAKGV